MGDEQPGLPDGALGGGVGETPPNGILGSGQPASYWFDACEDDGMCGIDFADFDPSMVPEPAVEFSGQAAEEEDNFFKEIDRIFESINEAIFQRSTINLDAVGATVPSPAAVDVEIDGLVGLPPDSVGINSRTRESVCENGMSKVHCDVSDKKRSADVLDKGSGCCNGESGRRDRDGEVRPSKRVRTNGEIEEGGYSNGRYERPRDAVSRKWVRDWEDGDRGHRREIDWSRRGEWEGRDRRGSRDRDRRDSRERDWRDRDSRGYWERDRSGKVVFRVGSWENREEKKIKQETLERSRKAEKGLEEKKEKPTEEQARKYQLDVLDQAKKKNTIAFLETGAGKTLIAVLLMKSVCDEMLQKNKKMLAIFLVPKVPLVYQQAEVIRERTGYNVGHYCGEMGQDFWDTRRWQREFETKQVMVMTAQILLNILRHSIIKMEAIHLLILDECHHAVKKHPYSLVMSEFYHTTPKDRRPAVFGMTASPVNLKGVSSQEDCAIKIRNLESKLDSIVCTIKDRKELERHVPMPLEVVVHYDKAGSLCFLHDQIKRMEVEVEEAAHSSTRRSKWQFMGARDAGSKEELRFIYGVSERTESDGAANLIQKLRAINYALGELGQWCAFKVALSFLTALQSDERANYQLDIKFQESYLNRVVDLLQCQLSEGAAPGRDTKGDEKGSTDGQTMEEIEEGELPDSHASSHTRGPRHWCMLRAVQRLLAAALAIAGGDSSDCER